MAREGQQRARARDKRPAPGEAQAEPSLVAYRVSDAPPLRLVSAPAARAWMHATADRFAQRCLPLLMANQHGWLVLNSHRVVVLWTGGDDQASLRIEHRSGSEPYPAISHFGYGILTWTIPYLFRTPPGYNLLVRGPANWPKDGASPLEGLVETDWSAATFTMNWKLTRPGFPVVFEVDEPICMLVPQRRGDIEAFRPRLADIHDDPELFDEYRAWIQSRSSFLQDLPIPGSEANASGWQRDYFRGVSPTGSPAVEHQLKLKVREFEPRQD